MCPFRDEYTNFSFNGITSEQMKVWITNSRDIQFRLTPEFTDTFVSPTFANNQILTGTNITKSTFNLKCIAINITMQEWRAIQQWLSPYNVGRLEFDFNKNTYYNAKVSKSITGTTFVKGSWDRLIGDLYIVEFNIEFSTVDDFAALGPVNIGILGKNFDELLIGSDTTEDTKDDYPYKIESVSNNKFFMPMIIKAQDITGYDNNNDDKRGPYLLNNREVTITLPNLPTTNAALGYFVTAGHMNEGFYFAEYELKLIDSSTVILYSSIDGQSRGNKLTTYTVIDKEFSFQLYGDDLFFVPVKDQIADIKFSNTNNDYLFCNPSSYEIYPTFLIKPFDSEEVMTINYESEEFYKYSYYKTNINSYLTFDCQHGVVLSGDTLAEQANTYVTVNGVTYKEKMFSEDVVNKGVLSLPSGNPEIVKIYTISAPTTIYLSEEDKNNNVNYNLKYLKIRTSSPLQFNHSRSVLHLFTGVDESTSFNINGYPYHPLAPSTQNPKYIPSFKNSKLLVNCIIFPYEDDYMIIGPSDELKDFINETEYYLSICDYSRITIEGDGFAYLQTRDVF